MRQPFPLPRRLSAALMVAALGVGFASLAPRPTASAADEKKAGATFEVYKDKGGEFRWRLRTTNSQIIATSGDGYKDKRSCLAGIESVKKNAADAKVDETAGS